MNKQINKIAELEKEAKEWLCNNLHSASEEDFIKAMVDIAEPREKHIVELEEQLEQTEKDLADYQFNYPTIKELEQENAELRNRNQELLESCEGATMMYKDLQKAKEIINELNNGLDKLYLSGLSDKQIAFIEKLQDKAEQFLNDSKQEE